MSSKYYFQNQDGETAGPVEFSDLALKRGEGQIKDDMVCREGDGTWQKFDVVTGMQKFTPPPMPSQRPATVQPVGQARASQGSNVFAVILGIVGFFGGGALAAWGIFMELGAKTAMHQTTSAVYISIGFTCAMVCSILAVKE